MNGVAYRASNQEMQDLVGGQIRIACDNFSSAWEQVQAGKIRALAITSAKRYIGEPDDGIERRAQLVAHASDELRLVLTRHLISRRNGLAIFLMDRSLHLNDSPYPPLLIGRMPDYSVHDKRAGLQPWSWRYSPRGTPHLESSRK